MLLIDEVMTPDSSRFWPADRYAPGRSQPSFDKQPLRDYLAGLKAAGRWNGEAPPPPLPADVVDATSRRYLEAYRLLTGRDLEDAVDPHRPGGALVHRGGLGGRAGAGHGRGPDAEPGWIVGAVLWTLLAVWVVAFFRDPERAWSRGERLIVAPADGKVVSVIEVDEPAFFGGRAQRISIFMNVFDCHVNRYPTDGTVAYRHYNPGAFGHAGRREGEPVERAVLGGARDAEGQGAHPADRRTHRPAHRHRPPGRHHGAPV